MPVEIFISIMLGGSALLFVTARTDYRVGKALGLSQIPRLIVCAAYIAWIGMIATGMLMGAKEATRADTAWVAYYFVGHTLIAVAVLMACSWYIRTEAAKRKPLAQ